MYLLNMGSGRSYLLYVMSEMTFFGLVQGLKLLKMIRKKPFIKVLIH